MGGSISDNVGDSPSEEREIVDAIEELIAEFGVRGVMSACLKSSAGEQFSKLGGNASLRVAQVILREIVYSQDPRLDAEIMSLGAGILLEDDQSVTKVALRHGRTKQAISKRVVAFCDANGLPPSIFMKSLKARKNYALSNQPRTA